ncbi:MAG: citrulline utilization hydrolase CtlX, partial [Flavobacteriaceae bacterium]
MNKQTTDQLLMIRPSCFYTNEQTATNNYFQQQTQESQGTTTAKAQQEFDGFVSELRSHGVSVNVWQDANEPNTPDALFPNNWISFHNPKTIVTYPMYAVNRQKEVSKAPVEFLESKGFLFSNQIDFTSFISSNLYLEGTGSMVLDRVNQIAYCARSERTNPILIDMFCQKMGYNAVVFSSFQSVNGQRKPIYHTNVMMSIGLDFAVVCLDSIDETQERNALIHSLEKTGKTIIELTEGQIHQFAGNVLELQSNKGNRLLAMSTSAFDALTDSQKTALSSKLTMVHSPLTTIER